jgi:hypothetical protein
MGNIMKSIKQKVSRFAGSNGFIITVLAILFLIPALIPSGLWYFFYWLISPAAGLERVITILALTALFGSTQIVFIIIWCGAVMSMIFD